MSSPTPAFLSVLDYVGLAAYRAPLLENGFEDLDALCDMTAEDMAAVGIPPGRRRTLVETFTKMRCARAMGSQQAATSPDCERGTGDAAARPSDTELFMEDSSLSTTAPSSPPVQDQPDIRAPSHTLPASPLGLEMLVPASTWTSVTADASLVQSLLALYFCWEYPVFTSLDKDHFVRDFCHGTFRYCSPMLVNALLALGYCWSGRQLGTATDARDPHPSGDDFFAESLRLFDAEEDHYSLTTIQTLGIMALREASCGRDTQSFHHAGQSVRLATEMGLHRLSKDMDGAAYVVATTTMWGAFGLHK